MEDETENLQEEEITPNEQTNEAIREEIEEQRELTELAFATIADVESVINGRINELREYIDGRFNEYATRIEGPSTNGTTTETETIIQEEDTKPNERHFWFRRIRE